MIASHSDGFQIHTFLISVAHLSSGRVAVAHETHLFEDSRSFRASAAHRDSYPPSMSITSSFLPLSVFLRVISVSLSSFAKASGGDGDRDIS